MSELTTYEDIQKKLNRAREDCYQSEDDIRRIDTKQAVYDDTFHQINRLFQETGETWQAGEMSIMHHDVSQDIYYQQKRFEMEKEQEKEQLQQKRRTLLEQEDELNNQLREAYRKEST